MNNNLDLDDYKQQVADMYSHRSANYDTGDWHPRIAHHLVEYAHLRPGQQVLDIATGTGMVALEAAQIVGIEGRVMGIDISTGMIEQAKRKAKTLGLGSIEFLLADAEALNFPENSFDYIFCSSALIWMSDLLDALRHWHQLLKPGGLLGFHAFADNAFVGGVVAQRVLEKYGVSLLFNKPTGTIEKCHNLLKQAGFVEIDIKTEQDGGYISLERAKGMWTGNSLAPAPGQHPNPLLQLSSDQHTQARVEFEAELETIQTEQGIWNDITIFYTFGRKAAE
ncbi:methylase involved in ubiquinone/menaquinone biosynthesis [Synechococcus sp. PCC 7502]|uniref:class I SAM-dependent methyltransferase n=1 Tax=Synechococcus sp. PCC 7502 TaxID=1173263 RepID=UPI00029FC27A|nr:methyltransferase domain-containing protein [Synechococcus sp. PCC 7502]AFY74600.1 methylase involved in ubiquinone/menaquinone biosynthesis [Synechococcus sp. PCC 7502]